MWTSAAIYRAIDTDINNRHRCALVKSLELHPLEELETALGPCPRRLQMVMGTNFTQSQFGSIRMSVVSAYHLPPNPSDSHLTLQQLPDGRWVRRQTGPPHPGAQRALHAFLNAFDAYYKRQGNDFVVRNPAARDGLQLTQQVWHDFIVPYRAIRGMGERPPWALTPYPGFRNVNLVLAPVPALVPILGPPPAQTPPSTPCRTRHRFPAMPTPPTPPTSSPTSSPASSPLVSRRQTLQQLSRTSFLGSRSSIQNVFFASFLASAHSVDPNECKTSGIRVPKFDSPAPEKAEVFVGSWLNFERSQKNIMDLRMGRNGTHNDRFCKISCLCSPAGSSSPAAGSSARAAGSSARVVIDLTHIDDDEPVRVGRKRKYAQVVHLGTIDISDDEEETAHPRKKAKQRQ
ncbi:hypothetical protein C8R46DRAFT_1036142 [Mycena filopes]|nr:hypothetical protein C8R46DRAFT_1036142 [Mycena filopes]